MRKNYSESYETLNRRLFLSLCTFYSIKNELVYFMCDSVLPPAVSYLRIIIIIIVVVAMLMLLESLLLIVMA